MKNYLPFVFVLFAFAPPLAPNRLPEKHWLQYKNPEDAGFSSQKLQKAHKLADQYNSASVLIIYKGAIVQSWGDASRRFRMHSSRKATQSALIGIYAWKGAIDINKSINILRKRRNDLVDLESTELQAVTEEETVNEDDIHYKAEEVKKMITRLPDGYRTVLSLYLLEGYDQEEISQILNISHNTVRTQYVRAKQKLLTLIKQGV